MDSRQHRRVRLRLPVRLRWTTPFGQKIELANTIDVSRNGALVSTKEPHSKGVMVWLTFPYDASLSDGQPEILARVVRCAEALEVIRATNARALRSWISLPALSDSSTHQRRLQSLFNSKSCRTLQPTDMLSGTNRNDAAAPGGRWLFPCACNSNGFPGLKRLWPWTFQKMACGFAVTASMRLGIT